MNKGIMFTLETICNKKLEEITKKDLANIQQIGVSTKNIFGEIEDIDFKELLEYLPNLKEITINEKEITPEDIEVLSNSGLEIINFIKCKFSDEKSLSKLINLKKLLLRNCVIKDYGFLKEPLEKLESLYIENPSDETEIDLSLISTKKTLQKLVLQRCIVANLKSLKDLNLTMLSLLWSNLDKTELSVLSEIPSLEKLYISEQYKDEEGIKPLVEAKKVRTNLNEFFVEIDEDEKRL